ncbi:MAG: flagellar basal body P-ring protein FlgI [Planctomycetes bacterium]|nr:flagellar basal body P-ring protein FlgI [Planctomycetota bacterium]
MIHLLILALAQSPSVPPPPPGPQVWTGSVEAPRQPETVSRTGYASAPPFAAASTTGRPAEFRSRIDRLVGVRGLEDNAVSGIGLVVGLAGTGDSIDAAKKLVQNLLLTRNIHVNLQDLESKNVAIVEVSTQLPAGLKPGRRVDVTVSTIGDATSLVGGVLLFTELSDPTGRVVYATASGPVTVGGFQASGQAGTAKKNHTTVGTLPEGGKVEREIETSIVSEHGLVHLDLLAQRDGLGNAVRIAESINAAYPGAAFALPDGRAVEVQVPLDLAQREIVTFVHGLLAREVEVDVVPRVVVNERTGTIVLGGNVRLRPGAIAHGSITVTIAESPVVSQPGPFSGGQTVVTPRTDLGVDEEAGRLVMIPAAVTLRDVVEVLDVLGATPRELVSILESMAQGGLLEAEIRRM